MERDRLAKQHLERALTLLRQAQAAGFFKDPAALERLQRQQDFEPLLQSPEGMKLVEEIAGP
jgi:hypothetical protein